MVIWKWSLMALDAQTLLMPKGAQVLSVQMQNDIPQIWALVDQNAPLETRIFNTYGTGNPMPDAVGRFVGTFQLMQLVFHVFEAP